MKIHKEGHRIIVITFIIFLILISIILYYLITNQIFIKYLLLFSSFAIFFFIVRFFRVPQIKININENKILSPANGKIVVIEEVELDEFINQKTKQISIFMSPNDVHVNRYPISGKILNYKYHLGKFLVAWNPKSSKLNERTSVLIENHKGEYILIRQIAGFVARRIVCYAKKGENVIQGDEMGFIKFGSRVDVFVPLSYKINVCLNQKVIGGKTILAEIN